MLTTTTPYHQPLGNNLILKSIHDAADAERLAKFSGQVFGEGVPGFARTLIHKHPATRSEHWLYIEDEASGQIVSMLCLIPWRWRYEDVTLKVGEMGIVGTLENYRHRGLVRALVARHQELLREGEYDLSNIQGIPYFYRQFGYEYALPLEAGWQLQLHSIPDATAPYTFRLATSDDLPLLARLYDEANAHLNIAALRDADVWRYLFEDTRGTEMEGEFWLVLDGAQQPVGYVRLVAHGFGSGLIVGETSRLNLMTAPAVLRWLKTIAQERGKPYLRLNLPVTNDLLRVARGWDAHNTGTYEWQIYMVDAVRLLRKLTPVLERRIAASLFNGITDNIHINLYHDTLQLQFERGKLLDVKSIGFVEWSEIRLPPLLFTPLLLGYRSHEELRASHPDVGVVGQWRLLVDVLFPKMDGFIFTNY